MVRHNYVPKKEGVLYQDKHKAWYFMYDDQFFVETPFRMLSGFGKEVTNIRFHRWAIFNDAATGIIWVENHISLGSGESVVGKQQYKEWVWDNNDVEV